MTNRIHVYDDIKWTHEGIKWIYEEVKWIYKVKWMHGGIKWMYDEVKWIHDEVKWIHDGMKWMYMYALSHARKSLLLVQRRIPNKEKKIFPISMMSDTSTSEECKTIKVNSK